MSAALCHDDNASEIVNEPIQSNVSLVRVAVMVMVYLHNNSNKKNLHTHTKNQ